VGGGDICSDGEPEPCAAFVAATTFVEADEPTHDVGALIRRDAGSVVIDVDGNLICAIALDRDGDLRGRSPRRVGDEVVEGAS
jgi:hypothetical protein